MVYDDFDNKHYRVLLKARREKDSFISIEIYLLVVLTKITDFETNRKAVSRNPCGIKM